MPPLTARRLEAIIEALEFRLAGEIEPDEVSPLKRTDYMGASFWAACLLEKRRSHKKDG